MCLVDVSGYVSRYDDDFDDTHFLYLKYGSFLDDLNQGKLKIFDKWIFVRNLKHRCGRMLFDFDANSIKF